MTTVREFVTSITRLGGLIQRENDDTILIEFDTREHAHEWCITYGEGKAIIAAQDSVPEEFQDRIWVYYHK